MRYFRSAAFLVAVLMIAILPGCGGSSEEATSPAKQATPASGLSPEELEKRIEGYKQGIADREAELTEIAEKLKGMSPADLSGEEAKSLEARGEALNQQIEDIKGKIDFVTEMMGN